MIKELQGSIVSYTLVALAFGMNSIGFLLSLEKVVEKMIGSMIEAIVEVSVRGSDPVGVPQEFSAMTVGLRRLISSSLKVSSYARTHGRATAGVYYCIASISNMVRRLVAEDETLLMNGLSQKINSYCSDPTTSSAWRAIAGYGLMTSTLIPLTLLTFLTMCHVYFSKRSEKHDAIREKDGPTESVEPLSIEPRYG